MLDSITYDEQYVIIHDLPREFFIAVSLQPSPDVLAMFLKCYERFIEPAVHTFSYAEVVANNMKEIFRYGQRPEYKAKALEIAVNGAIWANRYAAMDTCREMIMSVEDDQLGLLVGTIINSNKDTFVAQIEPSACKNDRVKKTLRDLQQPAK